MPHTYVRTVKVQVRALTTKKRGLLNRAMKDSLRSRRMAAAYFQEHRASQFGYDEKNKLYKEIHQHPDIDLPAHAIEYGIDQVQQNYQEFEKAPDAREPLPEEATQLMLPEQLTRLFYDDGYWLSVHTGPQRVNLPLIVSDHAWHATRFPEPSTVPPTDSPRQRVPGTPFHKIPMEAYPEDTCKLGASSLHKTPHGTFSAHLVFHHEPDDHPGGLEACDYVLGVDRGRNQIVYAALYNRGTSHVEDWYNHAGKESRTRVEQMTDRLQSYQRAGAYDQLEKLHRLRQRYKEHLDHKISRDLVDLAANAPGPTAIALDDVSTVQGWTTWSKENLRRSYWTHARLLDQIVYKADEHGIPVKLVPREGTSTRCSRCSEEGKRRSVYFKCPSCGYEQHADANAAVNIAKRALGHFPPPDDEPTTRN